MEYDFSTSEFVLTRDEWSALGHSADSPITEDYRIPVAQANQLLENCEIQRARISDIALSEYPAGANRSDMKAEIERSHTILRGIIEVIQPHLPSVADAAESYLHHTDS